jgi:hypothetical protein
MRGEFSPDQNATFISLSAMSAYEINSTTGGSISIGVRCFISLKLRYIQNGYCRWMAQIRSAAATTVITRLLRVPQANVPSGRTLVSMGALFVRMAASASVLSQINSTDLPFTFSYP